VHAPALPAQFLPAAAPALHGRGGAAGRLPRPLRALQTTLAQRCTVQLLVESDAATARRALCPGTLLGNTAPRATPEPPLGVRSALSPSATRAAGGAAAPTTCGAARRGAALPPGAPVPLLLRDCPLRTSWLPGPAGPCTAGSTRGLHPAASRPLIGPHLHLLSLLKRTAAATPPPRPLLAPSCGPLAPAPLLTQTRAPTAPWPASGCGPGLAPLPSGPHSA
jgi:hypothetical protein